MDQEKIKRHIAVIPPREDRNRAFLDELRTAILPNWKIIPHTRFYKLSYSRLINIARGGAAYDIVVAARVKDALNPERNNIYSAIQEIRRRGGRTIFAVSFNEFLVKAWGEDVAAEKRYLDLLAQHDKDPRRSPLRGVIRTTSTDPNFLISVLGDILDRPQIYFDRQKVYSIETQAQFLNHPPGATQFGIG